MGSNRSTDSHRQADPRPVKGRVRLAAGPVGAANGKVDPRTPGTNGASTTPEAPDPCVLEALRAEVTALWVRVQVAEAEARERDRVIAAKEEALGSLRAILAAGPFAQLTSADSAAPVPDGAPPMVGPSPALNGLGRPEDHLRPEPASNSAGTGTADGSPRRHRRWTAAPLPTTLDSLLAERPPEPRAEPKPKPQQQPRPQPSQHRWWRRTPRPEVGERVEAET